MGPASPPWGAAAGFERAAGSWGGQAPYEAPHSRSPPPAGGYRAHQAAPLAAVPQPWNSPVSPPHTLSPAVDEEWGATKGFQTLQVGPEGVEGLGKERHRPIWDNCAGSVGRRVGGGGDSQGKHESSWEAARQWMRNDFMGP